MNVDKSGGDDVTVDINFPVAASVYVANISDMAVVDGYVSTVPR
jgi:hypothetical protein